ncbi:hypothetical protein DPMN_158640 [Dreissena polymorpha]|uniref:Uncharacterized protein n=1 Tax=Dreissena polymorpha TaxID=45954 RepID=A0A9D4EJH3_DREPO|nr:hypothetical protein DPMN_078984 [Dreissena polymorpha]KAH3780818.1 hypothetical protein DPMN_158640 [Dreissena polymorpha]
MVSYTCREIINSLHSLVCEEEEEIKIWNIKVDPPQLLRNVIGKAQCRKVALCHGDDWIAMKLGNGIKVEGLHTGKHY